MRTNDKFVINDGDYLISKKDIPIKLHITVKGDKATFRDGTVGDVHDIRKWTFELVEPLAVFTPRPGSLTCHRCPDKDICKYANDPYNTHGDCLASK